MTVQLLHRVRSLDMEHSWLNLLQSDPLPALLGVDDPALSYLARRDLLDRQVEPVEKLWELPEVRKLLERQEANGSWHYPGKPFNQSNSWNYDLLQTFRFVRKLVEQYGLDASHPAMQKAAEYFFTCQTYEGDIRGILVNQYMPYYHGAILALLVKAGFSSDPRLLKGLDWLLAVRQEDGGWIVPAQALPARQKKMPFWHGPALPPDKSLPSSHLATDMAMRPFAWHPSCRQRKEVLAAARLLKSRLFQSDKYNDRRSADYWLKFQFPFWWHNLVATMDSLSQLGFAKDDNDIARGVHWFLENQETDGLWPTRYGKGREAQRMRHWVGLAICRVLKRFLD
jgi:hypothetical protein